MFKLVVDYFPLFALIIFYALFFGRAFFMFKSGTNPFPLPKNKLGIDAITEFLFFTMLTIWALEIVFQTTGISFHIIPLPLYNRLFDVYALKFLSMAMTILGMIIFIGALISFKKSWRVGIDINHPGTLITDGIFNYSRNPIYVFLDIYFIAIFLCYPEIFFLAVAVIAMAGFHIQILREEIFLERQYGADYKKYKQTVKRYFLFF